MKFHYRAELARARIALKKFHFLSDVKPNLWEGAKTLASPTSNFITLKL
tara:strand:+ start:340 stop:486 length:147 start_codon:yes stop_codon:yes gene_type:complete